MEYARRRRWYVQSQDDPRWDKQGEGVSTRFDQPQEMLEWLKRKEEEFGEKPMDLKVGYF